MADLLVIIPVLRRPHRAAEVFASLEAATGDVSWRAVFACTTGDHAEIRACEQTGADVFVAPWDAGPGDWARKINRVYEDSDEPWMLLGADDLAFHPGWAAEAMEVGDATEAGVVGTNDLGNPRVMRGEHSTHPLVRRSYADALGTVDGPGRVVAEAYQHQFCDDELVYTAKRRGRWAFARASVVEHLHPYFAKAPWDATYRLAVGAARADSITWARRRQMVDLEGAPA